MVALTLAGFCIVDISMSELEAINSVVVSLLIVVVLLLIVVVTLLIVVSFAENSVKLEASVVVVIFKAFSKACILKF